MLKQSLKNIISLRKKYIVAILAFITIFSTFLMTLNLVSGLTNNKNLGDIYIKYSMGGSIPYKFAIQYISLVVMIFGTILIAIMTKYISNMRAKEYSIYLIIAGVNKSKIYKQIIIENIILFLLIIISSLLVFLAFSYPFNYVVIKEIIDANMRDLNFFIQLDSLITFFKVSGASLVLFILLHMFYFSRLTVKQLMIASKATEVKRVNTKVKLTEIMMLTLTIVGFVFLVYSLFSYIHTNGGSKAITMIPVFIIPGFIINVLLFKYLIKILFTIITNISKKYNGLNKYYHSLIITKSNALSKILGSTASVIVVCISAVVIMNTLVADNMYVDSPIQYLSNNKQIKEKPSKGTFNLIGYDFKKLNDKYYIKENKFNKFINKYGTYQRKVDRNLANNVILHKTKDVVEKRKLILTSDKSLVNKKTAVVSQYIDEVFWVMSGLFDKVQITNKMSANKIFEMKDKEVYSKGYIQKLNTFIVSDNYFNKIKAKKVRYNYYQALDKTAFKQYKEIVNKKGTDSSYYSKVQSSNFLKQMKLLVLIIPLLGLLTQLSVLLFKFINSGWDNKKFSKLFLNLGFEPKDVAKIYLKETLTIFTLPLIIGILESLFVTKILIPEILLIMKGSAVIPSSLFTNSSILIVTIFMIIIIFTYLQYKSISMKDDQK